jgi:hypothetical protein
MSRNSIIEKGVLLSGCAQGFVAIRTDSARQRRIDNQVAEWIDGAGFSGECKTERLRFSISYSCCYLI